MDTYGIPWPIPLTKTAQAVRLSGPAGNSAYPVQLLQMPMQRVAWLLYRAATARQIVEFTPLASAPESAPDIGTPVDYTGQPGWDGTKFTHEGIEVTLPDPMELAAPWGAQYATPQAARDGARGYDVMTAEDPDSETWSYPKKPGEWMDAGPWAPTGLGSDGSMRYDIEANWPAQGGAFTEAVAAELAAWSGRLNTWLAAEQAKIPPNAAIVADIERQIDVADKLTEVINATAVLTLAAINQEGSDEFKTNYALYETDSYLRWIAAEEIMEAFSILEMPLNRFRLNWPEWTKFYLGRVWFSRGALQSPIELDVEFLTAGLTTAALKAVTTTEIPALSSAGAPSLTTGQIPTLTSNDIPALSTGQIAINLTRPLFLPYLTPPYGYNSGFRTFFTKQLTELDTDGITMLTTEQVTAIGPAAIGLSATDCLVNTGGVIPTYTDGVTQSPPTTQDFGALAGVEVGTFRIEDGTALSTEPPPALGTESLPGLSTQPIQGLTIYEAPLFATPERVGALNITWRILTTRP